MDNWDYKKALAMADVVERDYNGDIVGFGSDSDYDSHAVDVANGDGYYDSDGHYCSYGYSDY